MRTRAARPNKPAVDTSDRRQAAQPAGRRFPPRASLRTAVARTPERTGRAAARSPAAHRPADLRHKSAPAAPGHIRASADTALAWPARTAAPDKPADTEPAAAAVAAPDAPALPGAARNG